VSQGKAWVCFEVNCHTVKPAAQRDEVMQMLFPIGRIEPVEDRVYDVDDPTLGSSGPA
jgi:hypothetical protein